jgi:DNA-binding IclR family transcriptional regulator
MDRTAVAIADESEDPASACARDVLELLSVTGVAGVTVADVVAATGRNRSVVSRLMADLAELGLVVRDPRTRRIRLDWTWYVLAARAGQQRLVSRGQIVLDQLAADVGETAYLVVREGRNAVTRAEAIPRERSIQATSWVGRSWPIARSDAGPALLLDVPAEDLGDALGRGALTRAGAAPNAPRTVAEFAALVDAVRRTGYSALDEQAEAGVGSVAAPVHDVTGRIAAALVVGGPVSRMRPRLDVIGGRVASAAARLEDGLGAAPDREVIDGSII